MTVHIFLGPSLPLGEARQILDAEYHPPVRVGDVCDLLVDDPRPATIGIIDGLFEQTPTVWHKEILFAISQGVRVVGGGSMGAIRAAELCSFGMTGVGEVFELFRSGELEDDDEVAVAHAPVGDGSRPLSDAMVSIRDGLGAAVRQRVISPHAAAELAAGAKALFYPERSWPAVQEIGRQRSLPAVELKSLADFVREHAPDIKRRDAIALLTHVAQLPVGSPPGPPSFDFEPTFNWVKLVEIVRSQRSCGELGQRLGLAPADAHAFLRDSRPDLVRSALLDHLMRSEASRLGLIEPAAGQELDDAAIYATLLQRYRDRLTEYMLAQPEMGELTDAARAWQERRRATAEAVRQHMPQPGHRIE